jgi:hypothetical protein
MDLFAASGIDLEPAGAAGRSRRATLIRTLRTPLLKHKVVHAEFSLRNFELNERQIDAARDYARTVRSKKFAKMKETAVRPLFFEKILGELLGYAKVNPATGHTLEFEYPIRGGSVDVALGHFGVEGAPDKIVAPFELKGPETANLDAVMPGRGRSPVQQAWDYANDAPGCRWVLVSNCVEVRLYGFGRGRDAYEVFDLSRLDEKDECERLWFLLSADRLLGGFTERLLRESDSAYKSVTEELYKEYKGLRGKLIDYLAQAVDGPKLGLSAAIEPAQKILDRILFVAFAQRTALLPDRLLERARDAKNDFQPVPVWTNFLQLFRGVDQGSQGLNIWPYNGGLFAHDAVVDTLMLPDHLAEELAGLSKWDFLDEVPVTLLGRLFEQSVTDLEKLRAEARGEAAPKITKSKRDGVVYTPDMVTRFLVARTIGLTLSERFDALLEKRGKSLPKNGEKIFGDEERAVERDFWTDYAAALRALRVVDPACGSGAFLVAAFDHLAGEYARVARRLADLESPIDFDPFDEIVTKNLYGVDLNAESVEITRLALWLKTARNERRLQNLEATIKVGDSLIDDPAYTERPFDWRAAFPEVFAKGGFDIVIGNPPYVRMELIKPVKPYLEKKYVVAADRADLYAYFFEKGVDILKSGGRLGYISSSTFFRTGSGENLRSFLGDGAAIEAIVDFGDLQIFEGVTTYPAVITLRKAKADGDLSFLKLDAAPNDLDAAFAARSRTMPRGRLGSASWQLEDDALARLRDKIVKGKKTLGEVYGAPLRGIVTGLNEAFVIDTETRDRLVKRDPKSAELLVPFLKGENIKRWRVEPEGLFLINTPKGKVDIEKYPAIRDWLAPFRKDLEARATKQEWWELQQAQLAYQPKFAGKKIIYPHFQNERMFSIETSGAFSNDKSYFIPSDDYALLSLLNSSVVWFLLISLTPSVRNQWHEMRVQYLETLPIPPIEAQSRKALERISKACSVAAGEILDVEISARHRISADLGGGARLSKKLEDWHELDFAAFRGEVKRVFKVEIKPKERGDWEAYLKEEGTKVRKLGAEIEAAEREIDKIVYGLFDLTPEEIALLEASIAGQY